MQSLHDRASRWQVVFEVEMTFEGALYPRFFCARARARAANDIVDVELDADLRVKLELHLDCVKLELHLDLRAGSHCATEFATITRTLTLQL